MVQYEWILPCVFLLILVMLWSLKLKVLAKIATLQVEIQRLRLTKAALYDHIPRQMKYKIHSIVIHTGPGRAVGHYYTYIARWTRQKVSESVLTTTSEPKLKENARSTLSCQWFKLNDARTEAVDEKSVFKVWACYPSLLVVGLILSRDLRVS